MRDGDPGDWPRTRCAEAFATLDLPPLPPEMSPPTTEEVERAFAEIEASWNWSDDIGQTTAIPGCLRRDTAGRWIDDHQRGRKTT